MNKWDSYPEQFGEKIVDSIPISKKGYQSEFSLPLHIHVHEIFRGVGKLIRIVEWLAGQREFYARITKEIEEHALVLRGRKSDYLHISGLDVERFPTGIVDVDMVSRVEWTYTIDLDREIFSVWDSAHFKLDKIPRDGVWINALEQDSRGNFTIDMEMCPPQCVASPEMARPRMLEAEAAELRSMYHALKPTILEKDAKLGDRRTRHAHQCFHALAYVSFCEAYFDNYARYALRWMPSDFIFREMAFAVLSLAAGKVQFVQSPFRDPEMYNTPWIETGKVDVEEGKGVDEENFVPLFPIGTHIPDEQPGSAPNDTMYWFEGVLVSLAMDLDDRWWLETNVAKVVKYAQWLGKTSFEAVITDLLFVVMVEVEVKGKKTTVKHTMPLQLFPMNRSDHLSTHPSERPSFMKQYKPKHEDMDKEDEATGPDAPPNRIIVDRDFPLAGGKALLASSELYKSEANLATYIPGFIALQNFLDEAKFRSFDRAGVGRGVFPVEVYNRVCDYFDFDTHCASMEINAAFRAYGFRHFWIQGITMLDSIDFLDGANGAGAATGGAVGDKEVGPVLTFSDAETGVQKRFTVYRGRESYSYQRKVVRWCPVVGEGDRRSAMQRVGQRFMLVKEDEKAKGEEKGTRGAFSSDSNGWGAWGAV